MPLYSKILSRVIVSSETVQAINFFAERCVISAVVPYQQAPFQTEKKTTLCHHPRVCGLGLDKTLDVKLELSRSE